MYVVRIEFSEGQRPASVHEAAASLILRSLDKPTQLMRFDTFFSEQKARAAAPDVYRLLFEVKGNWTNAPTHAVFAEWQVNDPTRAAGFEESRRRLFGLRRQVLGTFAYNWLLQSLDRKGRYLVLGLYGDEEGATRLCRAHPEIQRFAQANPIANFAAVDLTGLCCFRVEAYPSA